MSYDLSLRVRTGSPPLTWEAFQTYFINQPNFEVGDNAAHYNNEDTGVYFHFYFSSGGDSEDPKNEGAADEASIAFNMNYFRPHTFGLEAVEVLTRVVQQFDLVVDDPQMDGMGEGDFSPEGFLRGWNAGNRFAFRAISQMRAQGERNVGPARLLTLPAALNAAYWRWNFDRENTGDYFMDDLVGVYVPPVWFCQENGQVRSFAIYPNLIPTAIPRVDYVLVLRNELPEPYAARSSATPGWVRWEDLLVRVSDYRLDQMAPEPGEEPHALEHPHLILFDEDRYTCPEDVPAPLAEWLVGLPDWPGKPVNVSPDQILDAELVEVSAPGGS